MEVTVLYRAAREKLAGSRIVSGVFVHNFVTVCWKWLTEFGAAQKHTHTLIWLCARLGAVCVCFPLVVGVV